MKKRLKQVNWGVVVAALIYIGLGILLLVWPGTASMALCVLLGAALIAYGVFQVVSFFTKGDAGWGWGIVNLVIGIACLVFGIFTLARPRVIIAILPIVLGCVVIVDSCISLKRALELRALNMEKWWIWLILSLVTIAFGVVMLFRPIESSDLVTRIIGGVLVYEGAANLISNWHVARRIRNHTEPKGTVEGTVVEEKDL